MAKARIMVVEDEFITAAALGNSLEKMGYEVCSIIAKGEDVLERSEKEKPDLVLMDVQLAGDMDGVETAGILRSQSRIPVIFLTAYNDHELVERAKWTEPYGYLMKPVRQDELRISIEITLHRVYIEKKLLESEARYRAIVEDQPDMICRFTPDKSITFVNTAYCRYYKSIFQELIGTSFDAWIHKEDLSVFENALADLNEHKPVDNVEYRIVKEEGKTAWLQWSIHALFFNKKEISEYQAVGRDITSLKLAEAEKKRLEIQHRHNQKMKAIGTLAGGIAHNLNNILFPIIGYTEMALDEVPEHGTLRENLEDVLKSARRAADAVKQIISFSYPSDENEKYSLRIHPIIKESIRFIRSSLPSTIEIHEDIDLESSPIMADPAQIHQIIINLCANAFDAMREKGGILEVSLKDISIPAEDHINKPYIAPGQYLKLSLSDTGHGMPKEILERIFDPYFSTRDPSEGTGMGLAIVYRIIESYNGHVTVYSEPDQGTVFNMYFPVKKDSFNEVEEISAESVPTGSERILVVDDEEQIVDMIEQVLKRQGYQVKIFSSSIKALEFFSKKPEEIDLVITDLTMPSMRGDELVGEMMKIRDDIPVILCSGFGEKISREYTSLMGIRAYLAKPVSGKQMARTVREVLDAF